MDKKSFLSLGKTDSGAPISLPLKMANRHGLIAGATGTGKTVTLRVLAEEFSRAGVPVFTADIKGDLSGVGIPSGEAVGAIKERAQKLGITLSPESFPVVFWDVYGKAGHPLRSTISEFGPLLLSRLFDLNDTQEGVLTIAFRIADDEGLPLLDLEDLRAMLGYLSDNADSIQSKYGNVAKASIGAIQRDLLQIEEAGGNRFFGEPAFKLESLLRRDETGKGVVNILDATTLIHQPRIYTTFLLWLLSELFEALPEAGDLEKPKLVFFFDEAHLLFDSASKPLLEKIEQVVRLIRSRGVGIYFVTQNPLDVPDSVLGQLGNRVQHALRAFTPRDQKAVRTAADTFRANPSFSAADAITHLAVGEALVSCLDEGGVPGVVERTWIMPPCSRLSPLTDEERQATIKSSPLFNVYEAAVNRESAFEILAKRMGAGEDKQEADPDEIDEVRVKKGSNRQGFLEAFLKSAIRSVGSTVGRQIMRGIFGTARR